MVVSRPSRAALLPLLAVMAFGAAACNNNGIDPPTTPIVFVGPETLQITDLRAGTGATIAAGQTAVVHYALWLYDPRQPEAKGTFIEDSRIGGSANTGVSIPLLSNQVIEGWVQGVPGMKIGGLRRLIIPPDLAFGVTGSGPIPPRAWVVFDIDLIGIAAASSGS